MVQTFIYIWITYDNPLTTHVERSKRLKNHLRDTIKSLLSKLVAAMNLMVAEIYYRLYLQYCTILKLLNAIDYRIDY